MSSDESSTTEVMPRPTYAPVGMAMGIMMLVWGIETMWIMSFGGALVMIWALGSWMGEICEQWRVSDER